MEEKVCKGCGLSFPATLEFFFRDPKGRQGLKSKCRTCLYAQKNAYRRAHPEAERERRQRYYRANRERLKDRWRKWERDNPEKARELALDYARRKPGKKRAKDARRRAVERNCYPVWANPEAIEEIYQKACLLTAETGIKHVVDHIIPLKHPHVCGLHIESNLRIVTELENLKKFNHFTPYSEDSSGERIYHRWPVRKKKIFSAFSIISQGDKQQDLEG